MRTIDEQDGVLELRVVQVRHEADGVNSLVLEDPLRRRLTEWDCGAHVDVFLGDVVRQYSLCGDPADRYSYTIAVLRETDSRGGSAYVHQSLRVGDLLEVGGPRNHFDLVASPEYVFIAGGIGITPIIPMLREVRRSGATWHLHYGGRSRQTIAYRSLVEEYPDRVTLWPLDEAGLIDIPSALGPPRPGVAIYCCGPEALINAVESAGASFPDGSVHVERFAGRAFAGNTELDTTFDVFAQRAGARVPVPAGRTVVDCLEEAGISVPTACRDGVCGSCITRVLAGVPDHRDSLLRPDDTTQMVLCVSRSKTDELVLDL